MAKEQIPKDSTNKEKLPTELVAHFLQNQTQELKNTSQEIKLRKLNEKNAYEYGCRALEAQKQDRKDQRAQTTLFMKYGFWLTIIILLLFSSFFTICAYTDNIHIVVSILKVMAYIIPSAVGGYFIGLNKGKKVRTSAITSHAEIVEE